MAHFVWKGWTSDTINIVNRKKELKNLSFKHLLSYSNLQRIYFLFILFFIYFKIFKNSSSALIHPLSSLQVSIFTLYKFSLLAAYLPYLFFILSCWSSFLFFFSSFYLFIFFYLHFAKMSFSGRRLSLLPPSNSRRFSVGKGLSSNGMLILLFYF